MLVSFHKTWITLKALSWKLSPALSVACYLQFILSLLDKALKKTRAQGMAYNILLVAIKTIWIIYIFLNFRILPVWFLPTLFPVLQSPSAWSFRLPNADLWSEKEVPRSRRSEKSPELPFRFDHLASHWNRTDHRLRLPTKRILFLPFNRIGAT